MTKQALDCPRIYVACLAAYNNGQLHGRWIDADQDLETIQEEIAEMLATSPIPGAEEVAIHDHDGFYSLPIDEYEPLENVQAMAEFIAEEGELAALLIENFHNVDGARETRDGHYQGAWESLEAYAEAIIGDCYKVPEPLQAYIDYRAIARDLEYGGDIFSLRTSDGTVHIFDNH